MSKRLLWLVLCLGLVGFSPTPSRADRLVRFVNKQSGQGIGVIGGATASGSKLCLWPDTHEANQHWYPEVLALEPGDGPNAHPRTLLRSAASGNYLGCRYQTSRNGCEAAIYAKPLGGTEYWYIEQQPNGWCYLRNLASRKVLGVLGGSSQKGAPIVQWDPDGSDNQYWKLVDVK